jgi:uncharacterized protein YegP (UPF0339 family)
MKKRNRVETYKAPNGEWRWRVIRNWRVIAVSSEGYKRKAGARRGIASTYYTIQGAQVTEGSTP